MRYSRCTCRSRGPAATFLAETPTYFGADRVPETCGPQASFPLEENTMSEKKNPAEREQDHNPAQATDERNGNIKSPQETDATMRRKNMPRDSDPATGYSSGRGTR